MMAAVQEVQTALSVPDAAVPGHMATDLSQSCKAGDMAQVKDLLSQGADARHQDEQTGMSPMMEAAKQGHAAVVQTLLAAGAPWNAQDRAEMSAGDLALDAGHDEARNLILPEHLTG
jgi:type IV protein arginine methyltransferase